MNILDLQTLYISNIELRTWPGKEVPANAYALRTDRMGVKKGPVRFCITPDHDDDATEPQTHTLHIIHFVFYTLL